MLSSTMRIRRAWAAMMPAVEWLARTPYSSDSGGAGKGKRSSMCQQACSTGRVSQGGAADQSAEVARAKVVRQAGIWLFVPEGR